MNTVVHMNSIECVSLFPITELNYGPSKVIMLILALFRFVIFDLVYAAALHTAQSERLFLQLFTYTFCRSMNPLMMF